LHWFNQTTSILTVILYFMFTRRICNDVLQVYLVKQSHNYDTMYCITPLFTGTRSIYLNAHGICYWLWMPLWTTWLVVLPVLLLFDIPYILAEIYMIDTERVLLLLDFDRLLHFTTVYDHLSSVVLVVNSVDLFVITYTSLFSVIILVTIFLISFISIKSDKLVVAR